MTVKEALTDPDSFVTTIMTILYSEYDTEFMEWDPETVTIRLARDYGIDVDQYTEDKIQAGITVLSTEMFYKDFNTFSVACNVLSLTGYSTRILIPPESDDIAWGCMETRLLDPHYDGGNFNDQIKRYTGYVLDLEGIYDPPEILSFAAYPGENPLDVLDEDADFTKVVMDIQMDKKAEFQKVLSNRVVQLLDQLEQLDISMNREFIKTTINKLKNKQKELP